MIGFVVCLLCGPPWGAFQEDFFVKIFVCVFQTAVCAFEAAAALTSSLSSVNGLGNVAAADALTFRTYFSPANRPRRFVEPVLLFRKTTNVQHIFCFTWEYKRLDRDGLGTRREGRLHQLSRHRTATTGHHVYGVCSLLPDVDARV